MKSLIVLWKKTFLKYFDINQNGKLDLFEILIFVIIVSIYNLFFGVLSNYLYDLLK